MTKDFITILSGLLIFLIFSCQNKHSTENVSTSFGQTINPFPGVVVFESKDNPIKNKVASPSILILPDGNYLVSHDLQGGTNIHISTDRGITWQFISRVSPLIWANLFENNGEVYLMGTSKGWGNILIYRSNDNGTTWSAPVDSNTGVIAEGLFHTGPVPVVKYKGKIWRSYEEALDPDNRRDFHAFAMCADENADLLQASSWSRTNSIRFDESWINARRPNWLEGNLVITPDNKLIDFMRLETWSGKDIPYAIEGAAQGKPRNEIAAIIEVDDREMTMNFKNEPLNFVHFPGAESKFTIRYDSISRLYWTITNKISSFKHTEGTHNGNWHQRNLLVLMSSPDLTNWEIRDKILRWNEGAHLKTWDTFGFQYVDWLFEDNDIIFVSRTSWYGSRYHDANMITFHRINNFRASTLHSEPQDLLKHTQHPELLTLTKELIKEGDLSLGDFNLKTQFGTGLIQNQDGSFSLQGNEGVTKNQEESLEKGRFFDLHITNNQTEFFSLENLKYTPIANVKGIKLKWMFSVDNSSYYPITNYMLNIDNIEGEKASPESTIYLLVYDMLHKIEARSGVTLRCLVIGEEEATFRFESGITLGGRKLQ